jgi:enoyl-CoA hydratase/carnithine racemase
MTLDYTEEGRIAVFILNRPQFMNALDVTTLCEFHRALADFGQNPRLQAGIITGTGDEAFCTGIDIRSALHTIDRFQDHSQPFPVALVRGLENDKPLIAAVNGLARGGGMEIALSCDIRIASENARFQMPEATLGINPAWGGTRRLARQVRWCQSAEMLLYGKAIKAQEAYRIGLVNRVVPGDQLMSTAQQFAEAICNTAMLGIRSPKDWKKKSALLPATEDPESDENFRSFFLCADDFYEGLSAFNGKGRSGFLAR